MKANWNRKNNQKDNMIVFSCLVGEYYLHSSIKDNILNHLSNIKRQKMLMNF